MKGQIKIEFILGVVVFAMVIFYVASQINTAFLSTNIDTNLDMKKAKSYTILEIISKNSDTGLALTPGKLNITKINTWEENNCSTLNQFDMGGYRLTITEDNVIEPLLFCGYVGIVPIRTNVVRTVKIDNNYGRITLEMW